MSGSQSSSGGARAWPEAVWQGPLGEEAGVGVTLSAPFGIWRRGQEGVYPTLLPCTGSNKH